MRKRRIFFDESMLPWTWISCENARRLSQQLFYFINPLWAH